MGTAHEVGLLKRAWMVVNWATSQRRSAYTQLRSRTKKKCGYLDYNYGPVLVHKRGNMPDS